MPRVEPGIVRRHNINLRPAIDPGSRAGPHQMTEEPESAQMDLGEGMREDSHMPETGSVLGCGQ